MPKLKPNERRMYLSFTEPEDIKLLERLERDAKKRRYPLATYVLLVLLEAYPEGCIDSGNRPATSE